MKTAGIILAGGKSQRMKQDKAELSWGGVSLIEKQFELLAGIFGSEAVFISGYRPKFKHVIDQEVGLGPLEGLRSTLLWMNASTEYASVIVIPIDMPFLTPEKIYQLVAVFEDVEVVKFRGFNLPVKFNHVYEVLSKIESLKKQAGTRRRFSFSELYRNLTVVEIEDGDEDHFININTPSEWNVALLENF